MRPVALLLCALVALTRAQYKPGSFESAVVRYRDTATNTITILEANEAHADLLLNWLLHARRLRLGGFVVVALDEAIHGQLQALEMPCFYDPTGDARERPRALLATTQHRRCSRPSHALATLQPVAALHAAGEPDCAHSVYRSAHATTMTTPPISHAPPLTPPFAHAAASP